MKGHSSVHSVSMINKYLSIVRKFKVCLYPPPQPLHIFDIWKGRILKVHSTNIQEKVH